LLKAQQNSIEKVKENMACSKLDIFARKELGKYGKNFIHSLGHGIGIDIHELPNVSSKSKEKLKDNMIFTIEPGVYVENRYGIRIEDDVLLNKNKAEVLTKTTKELIKV
jgi:Xaa-Pro aminopeptidase